jgi:uncharacterized LabA/DUF88 family protein
LKTNFYVDGFNLYYGSVKGTPYKWLDLGKLFKFLFPTDEVNRIRYFTANVKPVPGLPDDGAALRQQIFIRALCTIPKLTVHYGSFLTNVVPMIRYPIKGNSPAMVDVIKTEEKGSDVNLATLLIYDCMKDSFEQAVIVSADSDYELPIELARVQFKKRVVVLFPGENKSGTLRRVATAYRKINPTAVRVCQFPERLTDWKGEFHKPPGW